MIYIGNPKATTEKYLEEAHKLKEKWNKMITQKDEKGNKRTDKTKKRYKDGRLPVFETQLFHLLLFLLCHLLISDLIILFFLLFALS